MAKHVNGKRGLLAALAATAMTAGCLLVTPLEDFPAQASNTGGDSNAGGAPASSGSAGQTTSGTSGTSGSNAGGECTTNRDCAERGAGEPYRCRPSDHTCVRLKTEECPLAYGAADDPNAIFFGSFATLDLSTPADNSIVWAQRLALDELSGDNVGGLPDGPDDARRPLVMVVCDNRDDVVETALAHLTDDLEVPALLATLKPGDLLDAFDTYRMRDLFYLSPVVATRTLVEEADEDLIWHLLGQPSDLAPAYAELLAISETYVRAFQGVDKLRVALVTTTDAFDSELANYVAPVLTFNNKNVEDNASDGNYAGFTVDLADPQLDALAYEILAFRPHIVISAASESFTQINGVLQGIETNWLDNTIANPNPDPTKQPFYLLSPFNAGDLQDVVSLVDGFLTGFDEGAARRYVGISVAGAADTTLQNQYATRLRTRFSNAVIDSGNYYDAVYFLAYAMYGADGSVPLTGPGIAAGMRKLLEGESFNVGPNDISGVFTALRDGETSISLQGTLGPPDFDAANGVRRDEGSVFCFQQNGKRVTVKNDVLRYNRELGKFEGDFSESCFPGFFP